PAPAQWANATLAPNAGCSGVYLSWGDITNNVNGNPTSNVSWTQPNTFKVSVHNSGAAAASKVTATFKIANFGMPAGSDWQALGKNMVCESSNNPPGCSAIHPDDSVANNPNPNGVDVPAHDMSGGGQCTDPAGGHSGNGDGCIVITAGPW